MIALKSQREIELMRRAGKIAATALKIAGEHIKPGTTTKHIDTVVYKYIVSQGAVPSFLNYGGFPASACISINNQVIHGIPSDEVIIRDGDIVSVDVGACIGGYHGDCAYTYAAGNISEDAKKLLSVTNECLKAGVAAARAGNRLGDIGFAVASMAYENGYSVVKDFVGHGVGSHLHESPDVPNYGEAGRGIKLMPGMTIAIEPMINMGGEQVRQLSDGWTVVTADNSLSAHFEYTICVTKDDPIILTSV